MKKAMLLLSEKARDRIYGKENTENLKKLVELQDCCHLRGDLKALKPHLESTDFICSGWGMMKLDKEFLNAAPNLKAVFYGAGSVRGFVTEEVWEKNILITTAMSANAIPVAEATVAEIILALKKTFLTEHTKTRRGKWGKPDYVRGAYGAKIGIIGMGAIGKKVVELLQNYDVKVYCNSSHLTDEGAAKLGCGKMELDEMFETCDVVSLHAPNTPSKKNLIRARHFESMKNDAVFINTARGAIVNEPEMIAELKKGRIFACIDVTNPEPPEPDSPLFTLDNVFLTPHLTGSVGEECKRMGAYVVEEVRRHLDGEPPAYPVTEDMMEWMA